MEKDLNQKRNGVERRIVLDYIDLYFKNFEVDYSTFKYIDVDYFRDDGRIVIRLETHSGIHNKIVLDANNTRGIIEYVSLFDKDVCLFDVHDLEEVKMDIVQKIYLSYHGMTNAERDQTKLARINQYKLDEYEMSEDYTE